MWLKVSIALYVLLGWPAVVAILIPTGWLVYVLVTGPLTESEIEATYTPPALEGDQWLRVLEARAGAEAHDD